MVVLGIDPGLQYCGFGLLKKEGSRVILLDYGFLYMASTKTIPHRLSIFHEFMSDKITTFQVTDISLETPFLGKNAQNFLKLGYLRGILYLLAHNHNLTIHEFTPRQVKQSVTGFGGASKEQVARVVLQLFPRMEKPKREDVTDALAVTVCGIWHIKKSYFL